jgi:hypothetical protein
MLNEPPLMQHCRLSNSCLVPAQCGESLKRLWREKCGSEIMATENIPTQHGATEDVAAEIVAMKNVPT